MKLTTANREHDFQVNCRVGHAASSLISNLKCERIPDGDEPIMIQNGNPIHSRMCHALFEILFLTLFTVGTTTLTVHSSFADTSTNLVL